MTGTPTYTEKPGDASILLFPVYLSSTNLLTLPSGAALYAGDLYRFLIKVYMKKKYESIIVQADILPKEAARFCLKRLSLPAFCVEICPASG